MGIIQLLTNTASVQEEAGVVNLSVVRLGDFANRTLIKFTTLPGTGIDNQDYIGNLSGQLTFQPGESIKTIQVPIINDTIIENDETFSVAIGDAVSLFTAPGQEPDDLGAPRTAIITIKDNDEEPGTGSPIEFSFNNFTITESDGKAEVIITKTANNTAATVNFRTSDDYAKSLTTKPEYKDYTGITATLSFAPQETVKTVTIPIVNDNLSEINERFDILLSNPVGGQLGIRHSATVTINNDDSLPGIFTKEVVVSGLHRPSGFAWGNNGYMYITETDGKVKVFNQNTKTLLPTPFIDMTNQVNNRGQRGLLSFALDPQFPTKPYLYLGYTYDSPQELAADGPDSANLRTNRLVRITADPNTNFTTALPNSEKVLMEVPNGANFHASAGLAFGKDGSLFWGHGDGAVVASVLTDPQKLNDLNYPFGKLYRINPATGAAYTDNPFYDTANPDSYRSKVYSYGLRNPFRITIHPKTGEPYIADVGWDNWEEVNTGRGKNFGWPLYEGANGISVRTPAYANDPKLQNFYNTVEVTAPIYARNHKDDFYSMLVGEFYQSDVYPSIFKDSLFIANFNARYIEALQFDTTGTKVENSILFDTPPQIFPTQLSIGPDGFLYGANYQFLGQNTASIIRWVYDKASPKISISDSSITEGNAGTTTAQFVVSLDTTFSQPVKVNYSTAGQTAFIGSDLLATLGTLTFAPGVTLNTIQVAVTGDTFVEANETFLVNLSAPVNATLNKSVGVGTIVNDDGPPRQITISDPFVTEGNTGTTTARFIVSLSSTFTQNVTVNFATANETALSGSDYTAASGLLTFAPGTSLATINVPVVGDTLVEPNETFRVNLSTPINATLAKTGGVATIVNDDVPPPIPKITISDPLVTEGNTGTTTARFVVSLDSTSTQNVIVNFATGNETALSGSDYTAASGLLTFAPGTSLATINVPVVGDTLVEANETFRVNLSTPVNATLTKTSGVATILNDDGQLNLSKISVNDTFVSEGNTGITTAKFLVSLNAPSNQTIRVNYTTASQTASSQSDFVGQSGVITFAPGVNLRTIEVGVRGDTLVEPNETLAFRLFNPTNALINRAAAVATIYNDDTARVLLSGNVSITEGQSGLKNADFQVQLTNPSTTQFRITASTSNGTATAGTDYTSTTSLITFAPGTTTATFKVPILADRIFEANENFWVRLSNPQGGWISIPQVQGFIVNDDPKPQMSVSDVTVTEGNAGTTTAQFTVRLTNPSYQTISAVAFTARDSASSPTDYVNKSEFLSFAPGQTVKTFNVQVNGDTSNETNETFNVKLINLYNVDPGDITGVGTIINDDILNNQPVLGGSETLSLKALTSKSSESVTLNGDNFVNSAKSEKVLIDGLTQPDIFTTHISTPSVVI